MNISDHHTRVRTGGSPLPPSSLVVGILFGTRDSAESPHSVVDTAEVEYETTSAGPVLTVDSIRTKIELHCEVFPLIDAVGWYRVGDDVDPSDLALHEQMRGLVDSPVFVLVRSDPEDGAKDVPVSIYEGDEGGAAFLALEFELDAHEPERIAIEHVAKTQRATSSSPDGPGPLESQLRSVASSIDAMRERVDKVVWYLKGVEQGEISGGNQKLLRQAIALAKILPAIPSKGGGKVLREEFGRELDDALALSFLSMMTKTSQSLKTYSEKAKLVNDTVGQVSRVRRNFR
mmetsp:Transcript_18064/g.41091  ORF Transcript_18064/g.41091 Transcript_18064/m.41091 type:complete len:289 (-) Transcript_18064:160-1026(-)